MNPVTLEFLTERLELADQLLAGRDQMLTPQDLPGRSGQTVRAIDRVLGAMSCEAVLAGSWAVWRHGYLGRLAQDVDIVLPADRVDEFLRVAAGSGFEVLRRPEGRWPRMRYTEADVRVDVLPEGTHLGTLSRLSPTTIPHPSRLGAAGPALCYITFPCLVELKLAAGWIKDESDVIELLRANPEQADAIRTHLVGIHSDYVQAFDRLLERARDQRDE